MSLKLTPCDVKSFFFSKTPGWSCDVTTGVYNSTIIICVYNMCAVFKGLKLSPNYFIGIHICALCCCYLLLYDSVDFSARERARACAPGIATLLLRIFVGKLPRRPVFEEREGKEASCSPTARWFDFFQGWARGHARIKVPNPNL